MAGVALPPRDLAATLHAPKVSVRAGIVFVEQTVGSGSLAKVDQPLPLIIVLHGLGDVPERFMEVLRTLPIRAHVAAARGLKPFSLGYGWLPPSRPHDIDERAEPLRRVAGLLAPAISELAASRPTCGQPIVVGFSQGAMVTYALAASPRPLIGAAFPIAGYLPPKLTPKRAPVGAPRIVALHGTADQVVELRHDVGSVGRLARVGYSIELRRFPGIQHTITEPMRDELGELVRDAARAMGCTP